MPRVAVVLLVASALLMCGTPGMAQIQRPPMQPQQAPPQQPQVQPQPQYQQSQPQPSQPQQPQMLQQQQQPQMQLQQMSLEQRRALQLPGTLVVERAGTVRGTIQSQYSPAIDCGTRCEYRHQAGAGPGQISLKVVAAPGTWVEWSGACAHRYPQCLIQVSADTKQRVVATIHNPRVTVQLLGAASIAGPDGFVCNGTNIECQHEYEATRNPDGSFGPPVVQLNFSQGSRGLWSGCDRGLNQPHQCTLRLTGSDRVVQATVPFRVNASKQGDGAGQVTATPEPFATCNAPGSAASCGYYVPATQVTLKATGEFTRWMSGPCSGGTNPTCVFTIAADVDASAAFAKPKQSTGK